MRPNKTRNAGENKIEAFQARDGMVNWDLGYTRGAAPTHAHQPSSTPGPARTPSRPAADQWSRGARHGRVEPSGGSGGGAAAAAAALPARTLGGTAWGSGGAREAAGCGEEAGSQGRARHPTAGPARGEGAPSPGRNGRARRGPRSWAYSGCCGRSTWRSLEKARTHPICLRRLGKEIKKVTKVERETRARKPQSRKRYT